MIYFLPSCIIRREIKYQHTRTLLQPLQLMIAVTANPPGSELYFSTEKIRTFLVRTYRIVTVLFVVLTFCFLAPIKENKGGELIIILVHTRLFVGTKRYRYLTVPLPQTPVSELYFSTEEKTIYFGSGSYLEGNFRSGSRSCPLIFSDPDPNPCL